jgi:hypothetical protein
MNPTFPAAALAALLMAASPASAQDPRRPPPPDEEKPADLKSTVELSYLWALNHDVLHPVGLARFQLSLETLLHGTLDDALPGTSPFIKGVFFAGVLLADRTIAKVGHEYGHIAVFNRAGYQDFLMTVGDRGPEALTFREVFINSLVPQRVMAVQLEEDDAQDAAMRFAGKHYEEFNAITYAGGLNQEQIHLNLFRDRVLKHQFGFFDTSSYLIETISTLAYTNTEDGDLDGYVDSLGEVGVSTSIPMVKSLSVVRFLSGTAVSAGIGFYRAMTEDRYDGFAPRVIGGDKAWSVLWPEFESHLTRRGPTVRASLPVRVAGFLVLPGLESAIADEGWEFEVGLEASRPATSWLDARAGVFGGTEGGFWGEAGVAAKLGPVFSVLLSYHFGNGYTFRRDVYGETFDFEQKTEHGVQLGFSTLFNF